MTAFVALMKREYIEHRAAFVIAPAVLLTLLLVAAVWGAATVSIDTDFKEIPATALKFYEALFAFGLLGWWAYLMITLVFYYANAFSADRRNNAMLFWKSMPQSDLKILTSKMVSGLTIFPAGILAAGAVTGLIAYLPAMTLGNILSGFSPPGFGETVVAWANVMAIGTVYFALALLWYLPFFAWVGVLSTIVGRWSIPVSVLIPGVIALFENIALRGLVQPGGEVLRALGNRLQFGFASIDLEIVWRTGGELEALPVIGQMLTRVDWVSLVGGVAVAVVFLYVASEYRRRFVLT